MRVSAASIALIRREADGQTQWLAQWNERWQAFSFVGGHKHEDESFRECVVREIAEELDLREGVDVLVSSAALHHLEYSDVSRRTGEETGYVIELFDVALIGSNAAGTVAANPANRWLSEPEIMAEQCPGGLAVSPTLKRFLRWKPDSIVGREAAVSSSTRRMPQGAARPGKDRQHDAADWGAIVRSNRHPIS